MYQVGEHVMYRNVGICIIEAIGKLCFSMEKDDDYFAAYRGITKAYKEGLTKAIGVANFYPAILANLCETVDVIPAVNQVELHPYFVQQSAVENMKAYGVVPQAWGPLAEGKHGIFTDPELTKIGEKYGKTAAQVALRCTARCINYSEVCSCRQNGAEY